MSDRYDVIIGLEIHAELATQSKMFCSCDNDAHQKAANTTVCPICLAHPGTLPVPNKQAIEWTILVGLMLGCQVNRLSKFDRKNYFYPDLPKGYQISQYDLPLVYDGRMPVNGQDVAITRIHLEEDTGKSSHPAGRNYTLVDFNRGGTPLMEMVTEPVIRDAATARQFCQQYQQILRYLGVSNADMEKGEMRCEANVSVQKKGSWLYEGKCVIKAVEGAQLNPKIELKNINSFKAMERAINYEVARQIRAIDDGEKLIQETRGWDDAKGVSVHQRVKEGSADYRYFPEPDIPPLVITEEWLSEIRRALTETPWSKQARFMAEYGFNESDAELLVSDRELAKYSEQVISELRAWCDTDCIDWQKDGQRLAKLSANWILSELFKHLKEHKQDMKTLRISAENFAELIAIIHQGKINSSAGQSILEKMFESNTSPIALMKELNLEQIEDHGELEGIVKSVIAEYPEQAEQYRQGKEAIIQFLVGKVMAASKGKAKPQSAMEILKKELS